MSLSPAPVPAPGETPLFARDYAIRLGLVLLIAFAAIIALAGYDESRRDALENFEEVTAVGDRSFFALPAEAQKPHPATVVFRGQPLYPVSYALVEARDTGMIRAGMADDAPYRVYTPREPLPPQEGESEKPGQQFYYLKVAQDEYLKLRPGTPGK